MSGFEVNTEQLLAAGATVATGVCDFDAARSAVAAADGALAATPPSNAYEDLILAADGVLKSLSDASEQLSKKLHNAGVAYALCEQSIHASATARRR
jgi:hypothetical protein